MSNKNVTLKDENGNILYPKTLTSRVINTNNQNLDTLLGLKADAASAVTSVTVGTTTTGAAGSNASVTNSGTATAPVLNFTIPQGAKGDTGATGATGPQGERGPQGDTGVTVEAINSIIHSIDPATTYGADDVAGADAVQDIQEELTELGGEVFDSLHTQEAVDLSLLVLKNFYVGPQNVWVSSQDYCGKFLPVNDGEIYTLTSPSDNPLVISIVKSTSQVGGSAPDFSSSFPSRIVSETGEPYTVTIPSDAHYIYVRTKNNGADITPTVVRTREKYALLANVNNLAGIPAKIQDAEDDGTYEKITYVKGSTSNRDGSDATDANCIRTGYLELTGISSIKFYVAHPVDNMSVSIKPTWYKSDQTLLSTPAWTSLGTALSETITVPNNAAYVRIVVSAFISGSQIVLSPSSVETYGFKIEPFDKSDWFGLLKNVKNNTAQVSGLVEDVELLNDYVLSQEDEQVINGDSISSCGGTVATNTGLWRSDSSYYGGLINCTNYRGQKFIIKKGERTFSYAFMTSGFNAGYAPEYATGYSGIVHSSVDTVGIVPDDAVYLYVYLMSQSTSYRPSSIQFGIKGLVKKVKELDGRVDNISANSSFRICSYNIGHFSHGDSQNSSITSSDYTTKLASYRQLIYGKIGADVIGLCEYSAVFGNDGESGNSAKDVLFNRYESNYIGEQIRYSCNALYSNMYIENVAKKEYDCNQNAVITHTSAIQATDYYYLEGDLWFNGAMIKLVMTHLAFDNNNSQVVANQIAELVEKFGSYERVILMGDWNAGISRLEPFVTAGYTLGNDGSLLTYTDTNPQSPLDNIIVKGVSISNVQIIRTSGLSDHCPIFGLISL